MSGHTPGPWWSNASRYGTIYVEANAAMDKRLLQEVCAVGPTESGRDQQEANARLIAAAPELLAALIAADSYLMGEYSEGPDVCDLVQSAIAKATQP